MWKDYSRSYIKNNRAAGVSVAMAAFISALLLSVLCSIFYNLWHYETERIKAEEGGWQARITGEIDAAALEKIQHYANVEKAVINQELSDGTQKTADIYFKNMRTVLTDMPQIASLCGLPAESVSYHHMLLNMYLVRDPEDPAPRLIFPFFLAVTVLACLSLVLIICHTFAVSMQARIHQFGIFSSIGATPRQIRTCLLQEAFALCLIPAAAGNLLGIFLGMGMTEGINVLLADVKDRLVLPFAYHPFVFAASFLAAVAVTWFSAWIPAGKLSRLTPLEAIKNTGEFQLKRKKNSRILSLLYGIEGELAGNALKAQSKALRTAAWSLTFSFLSFTLMMCFITLTQISQRMTYFEKYQDAWDVMLTVKDAGGDIFEKADRLQELPGIRSSIMYQKAQAERLVTQSQLSDRMRELGSLEQAPCEYVAATEGGWLVHAPVVILDDASFLEYCKKAGAKQRLDGAVIRNSAGDASNPNFRKRDSVPYLKEDRKTTVLLRTGTEAAADDAAAAAEAAAAGAEAAAAGAEIPVLGYTEEVPVLREEYGTLNLYELVHFIPVSLWEQIKEKTGGSQEEVFIRILAKEGASLTDLQETEEKAAEILGGKYEMETENRLQERMDNDDMYRGMKLILSGFCALLAMIGLSSVFLNTFGFVRQRKREIARYLSVGMTPAEIRKMFCIEALVTAGRPVLITVPVTVAAVAGMLKASYLEAGIFLREAPVVPVLAFVLAVFGAVALAYGIGGSRVLKDGCLAETLRDDTMM